MLRQMIIESGGELARDCVALFPEFDGVSQAFAEVDEGVVSLVGGGVMRELDGLCRCEKRGSLEPAQDRWEVGQEFDEVAVEFGLRVKKIEGEVVSEEEETKLIYRRLGCADRVHASSQKIITYNVTLQRLGQSYRLIGAAHPIFPRGQNRSCHDSLSQSLRRGA